MGIIDMNEDKKCLSEEELTTVIGGAFTNEASMGRGSSPHIQRIACAKCKKPFWANLSKEECMCPMCSHVNQFKG